MIQSPLRSETVTSADGTTIGFRTVGSGPGLIVVGGALSTAETYGRLGDCLKSRFAVHLMDRRGRDLSGPQGHDYSVDRECEGVLAIAAATGSTMAFGHSFGGLVVLESALRSDRLQRIAVYDPAVSVGGSIPTEWIPRYRELLSAGDSRGAFALFVQKLGPTPIRRMPQWYLRFVLRAAIRSERWRRMEPLLAANANEHDALRRQTGPVRRYAPIRIPVLLLAGAKSPHSGKGAVDALHGEIATSELAVLKGLDHSAPEERPDTVAGDLSTFFSDAYQEEVAKPTLR